MVTKLWGSAQDQLSGTPARALATVILCALVCNLIGVLAGLLGTLTYQETFSSFAGMTLQHLRPLHTTFVVAWIYLAACAVVYYFLISQSKELPRAFWLRLKLQLILWGIAGVGTLISLFQGVFSGREYMGAHWSWSVLIYLGWILFTWNYFSVIGFRLRGKPAFQYMWATSLVLFLWTFAEGHAWHLALVGDYPLRDIAFQWKSYGPLVGTFNLLVYGALAYLACLLNKDTRYAHSNTAFMLFFVGVFNSFTNFGHHTYHLPQSHLVKWISISASLAETVIVLKLLVDVFGCLRKRASGEHREVHFLVLMATAWSFLLVTIAVAISVPPVNTLIHGTHFVMAHAMGSMIGIDSMVLWAVLFYILQQLLPAEHKFHKSRSHIPVFAVLNVATFALVLLLAVRGAYAGYLNYLGPAAPAPPSFFGYFPEMFMVLGALLGLALLHLNSFWIRALLTRRSRASRQAAAAPQTEEAPTAEPVGARSP
jgi:nitric oxide reductase subunit B